MTVLEKAELRDIREEDFDLILQMRNQDRIRKVMFKSDIISFVEHSKWLQNLKTSETEIAKIFYYNEKPYGMLKINQINKSNGICKWGFYIGDLSAPKGMGTILGYTSLNFIFNTLNIRKVCAEVIEKNNISISFHEKLGFIQEGILRKQILKDNSYIDLHLYGIFNEEWFAKSSIIAKKITNIYT